jgi:hypothetical protein
LGWHMTSVRGYGSLLAVLILTLAAFLAACAPPKDQLADDSCEAKASKAAMDESCVIELSKREIAARLDGTTYAK